MEKVIFRCAAAFRAVFSRTGAETFCAFSASSNTAANCCSGTVSRARVKAAQAASSSAERGELFRNRGMSASTSAKFRVRSRSSQRNSKMTSGEGTGGALR